MAGLPYLRERTEADETVQVWGHEGAINYLAERRSPTKFAAAPILFRRDSPHFETWRSEFLSELAQRPPRYVVVVSEDTTPIWRIDSLTDLQSFEEFGELLEREYVPEGRMGKLHLYRRVAATGQWATDRVAERKQDAGAVLARRVPRL